MEREDRARRRITKEQMKIMYSFVFLSCVSLNFSCAQPSVIPSGKVAQAQQSVIPQPSFETIELRANSCFTEKKDFLITDAVEWEKLWRQKECPQFKIENEQRVPITIPAPPIDFTQKNVIAVFAGLKYTGGYIIQIKNVIRGDKLVEVQVEEVSPGNRCVTASATSVPFHLATIDKTEHQVIFTHTQRTRHCD